LQGWEHPRNVLLLDEPTAALHGEEVQKLFRAVRLLAASGAGVIFISHRLDEVIELADRVLVLRDGRLVADERKGRFDQQRLVEHIAGGSCVPSVEHRPRLDREPVLEVRGLHGPTIDSLDFDLHAGEVLGVSGVLGSGREQLAPILFGAAEGGVGELRIEGRPQRLGGPGRDLRRARPRPG